MITEEEIEDAAAEFAENTIAVGDKDLEHGFNNGAKWMQEQLEPKWIPVSERLPKKEGVNYLVIVKNKNKEGGIFLFDVGYFEEGIFYKNNTWENVTHWMPLPEPPKTV